MSKVTRCDECNMNFNQTSQYDDEYLCGYCREKLEKEQAVAELLPFDLELALGGHLCVTREGLEARVIFVNPLASDESNKKIAAAYLTRKTPYCEPEWEIEIFYKDGRYNQKAGSQLDLFLVDTKGDK